MISGQNANVTFRSESVESNPATKDEKFEKIFGVEKTPQHETQVVNVPIIPKAKVKYSVEETEVKKIEVEKDIIIRLLDSGSFQFVDIRKYYKGYPTKRGIRIRKDRFDAVRKVILEEF